MSRIWLDVDTESRLLDEVAQRQQRLRGRVKTVTPQMADMAAAYGEAYPWIEPDVVTPLLQFGVPPESPQAQSVATLAAQQAAEDGAFDTPAEDVPEAWYEKLADTMFGWVKPAVRTGFTILSVIPEELDALFTSLGEAAQMGEDGKQLVGLDDDLSLGEMIADLKNLPSDLARFWDNYTNKAARSGGILALGDLLQGKHVDLGQGWLPGGKIYEERERAKQRLQLDGEFLTPGRLVARTVVEPGSTPYQVVSGLGDLALDIYADPVAAGLKAVSRGAQATRTFQATGVLNGIRKTVDTQTAVNHYLTSNVGRRLVRFLSDNQDVETAWRAIGRADLGVAESLARAGSDTEVMEILSRTLGTVVRERPTGSFVSRGVGGAVGFTTRGLDGLEFGRLFGGGAAVRRAASNSRFFAEMPGQVLNPHNLNHAAIQLDNWARNARLPEDVRKQVISEVAQLADGDSVGLFQVTRRLMRHTESELVDRWGMLRSRAQKLTQLYPRLADDLVAYAFDDMGRAVDVLAPMRVRTGEQLLTDPKGAPMLISELVSDTIPLPPTARDIRRATASVLGVDSKTLSRVYSSTAWKLPIDGLEHALSSVWKPFQLLRGAYTFRVIGEEQVRMAGAGYDSMISNPASAIAWALAVDPKSRLGRKMADLARKAIDPKGTTTVTGDLWDDIVELKDALSRGAAGHAGLPGELLTGRFVKAARDDPDFFRGWATELAHLGNDPVVRRLAGGLSDGDIASIKVPGWSPRGAAIDDVKEWWWSGSGQEFRKKLGSVEGRSLLLTDRIVADEYIDMIADRLRRSTGGNSDLVEMIATGRLGDINIRDFGHERKLSKLLEQQYADAAPNFVKKPETVRTVRGADSQWRRLVDMGFDALMSKPTNWLSRSPTFRQMYWQRVEELIGLADRPTQEALVRAAREANVGDDVLKRMARRMLDGEGTTLVSTRVDDVEDLSRLGGLTPDEFEATGEVLFHGTPRGDFEVFESARAGANPRQGGKFYFTDDPAVASRFAQSGIPERSLSEFLDLDRLDDLDAADVESLFRGGSGVSVSLNEVDDAGNLVFRNVNSPQELVDLVRSSGLDYLDEVVVRQLRPDRAPRVLRRKVYGKKVDLTGVLREDDLPEGLLDALRADGLVEPVRAGTMVRMPDGRLARQSREGGWHLKGWQAHERRFKNTAEWMRAHGYGKAVVPDDPTVSGPSSIIALEEFIEAPGRNVVDELVGTREAVVDNDALAQVDYIAKSFALDETKKLLYDLNKRSQFFDMTRLIFPFGEAWKEIITAWTSILRKNPAALRRFQQGVQGARAASVLPGAQPGLTMPAGITPERAEELEAEGFGRGFFHTDPTTGEEVFTYPAGWAGKLLGILPGPLGEAGQLLAGTDQQAGVRLVGRAAGLNIVSATVLPGFGPAIQIPASLLIPQTPEFDDLREIILPFGAPEGDDILEQTLDVFTPAWFDKLRTAWQDPEKHRLFASTVADVQRALLARGNHDIGTLEGQQALYDEAVSAARGLFVIRAIAQMNVPTGPSFQWNTTDVRGNVVPVKLLSDEYRRLAQEEYGGDWEAAFTEWVNRFGVNNVLALIGKSYAVVERPVTQVGDEWLRAHQDQERDFPTVIGYFAPEPAAGQFDYSAYLRQFETKAREATTPAQQLDLANNLLGRVQWEQVKQLAALRPGPQTSLWMAQMREVLAEQYPGFDGWVAESQFAKRPKIETQIAELRRAITDPELARTDVGQGVAKYLSALDAAQAMVTLLPGNVKHYQQAKSAEPIRFWLRSVAKEIIQQHPDFARVWNGVFERELADDDPTTLGGAAA